MRYLLFEIDYYSLLHTRQAFPLVCRSSPPPQSQLALGRGEVVTSGRGVPKLCPHLATFHVESHGMILWCQVWAQLRHAPAPAHLRPQAQRQPGLRMRGPAQRRRRAAARTAAEQAAASENVAKEVTGSVTEQVAKVLTKQVVA